MAKPGFYAVRKGRKPGIYRTWDEAERQVKGFPGSVYKKFVEEFEALDYMKVNSEGATNVFVSNALVRRPRDESGEVEKSKKRLQTESQSKEERSVYCDGSALGNGKVGSVAGIGVFWPSGESESLAERVPGQFQTNNRAEMYALARILEDDPTPWKALTVCTDSEYVIKVFSAWLTGWIRNDWKTSNGLPVVHQDLILYVLALMSSRMPDGSTLPNGNVIFRKVKAHVGIPANEEADRLAKIGATKDAVEERDLVKATSQLKLKLKEKRIKVVEEFEIILGDDDLYTDEELRKMEMQQEF